MFSQLCQMIRQRRMRKELYSTQAFWDFKATTYDETAVSMWRNQSLNSLYEVEQIGIIQRHVKPIAGRRILDLGCGTGRFSRWFSQQGAQVTGIDFSNGSLDIARKLSSGENPKYQHGSIFELTEDESYDVVFIWGVLTVACRNEVFERCLSSDSKLTSPEWIRIAA